MDDLTLDEYVEAQIEEESQWLEGNLSPLIKVDDVMLKELEKYTKALLRARKTNNYAALSKYVQTPKFKEIFSYNQENICPNAEKDYETIIDDSRSGMHLVNVKKEKLSVSSTASVQSVRDDADQMPAPKAPPPKTKHVKKEKVSNITKVKQELASNTENAGERVVNIRGKTSDVIIENPVIPVIDLSESLEKIEIAPVRTTRTKAKKKEEEEAPIRSTRTRTKKLLDEKDERETDLSTRTTRTKTRTKRDRSESETDKRTESKRSKSNSPRDEPKIAAEEVATNISSHTEYEDAVSQLECRPNATFVVPENTPMEQQNKINHSFMNATVTIEKSKISPTPVVNGNDLLTDDESIEEQVNQKHQHVTNQVFSPYEHSPVKKKVEAFEKYQKNETTTSKMNNSRMLKEIEKNKGNVKEKAKGFIGNGNTPSGSRIGKYIGQKSSISNNSLSVSKIVTPKTNEFKERELRRQEKERELRKKELQKQALTEERKRKYEEKVLRAQQQQREAKEKELEKAMEIQRLKEERYKLVLQQKEEKQRLLREENERKRLLAKQRAEEKKKEEDALRLANQDKRDPKKRIENDGSTKTAGSTLIYLLQPTPPMPCDDCYDSDDERYNHNQRKLKPEWATKHNVKRQDYCQVALGHKIKNTFFCCQSQNIDLRDVFERIDPKKLKRTSSAHWERPPRFTLLPPTME